MNNEKKIEDYPINSIATYTGHCFDLAAMDPDTIDIRDIARALSMNCRWGGHVNEFYSVAEHSARVCENVKPEFKLAALLHDASEAYLLDIPKPFKNMLPDYMALEDKLMRVIAEKFGFEYPLPEEVKIADRNVLEWEWDFLKGNKFPIRTMGPNIAEMVFLKEFYHWKKVYSNLETQNQREI